MRSPILLFDLVFFSFCS